jgi:hypothetical protein
VEALEGHFGALESTNLGKSEWWDLDPDPQKKWKGWIRIRITVKESIWIRIKVKSSIRIRINVMRIRNID